MSTTIRDRTQQTGTLTFLQYQLEAINDMNGIHSFTVDTSIASLENPTEPCKLSCKVQQGLCKDPLNTSIFVVSQAFSLRPSAICVSQGNLTSFEIIANPFDTEGLFASSLIAE